MKSLSILAYHRVRRVYTAIPQTQSFMPVQLDPSIDTTEMSAVPAQLTPHPIRAVVCAAGYAAGMEMSFRRGWIDHRSSTRTLRKYRGLPSMKEIAPVRSSGLAMTQRRRLTV
jgi:hypothetical protein